MRTVIMIIRVSVMFNQRKRTSQILFFLYSIVTINTIVFNAYWYGPQSGTSGTYPNTYDDLLLTLLCDNQPVTSNPLPDGLGTVCSGVFGRSPIGSVYDGIPRGLFDILLLILAVYRFTVHSIETQRIAGKPRTNQYMKLLLEHSVIYFFLYVRLSSDDFRNTYTTQRLATLHTRRSLRGH